MRKVLLLASLVMALSAKAQLAQWVIHPAQDSLKVKVDQKLLVTDSLGWSILWTMDGKRLFATEHTIRPYKEGIATIVSKTDDLILGFVDLSGKFTALPGIRIAYDNPDFNDGFVICREKNGFGYYDQKGDKLNTVPTVRSYPFHRGYAPYFAFDQMDKRKDPFYGYHSTGDTPVDCRMMLNGELRPFDYKEIAFLSGIGRNNKGVAVIKNKLYWYDPAANIFEPLVWGDDTSEKRRQLVLEGDLLPYFMNLPSDGAVLTAKYGKKQQATLRFDAELLPTRFTFEDGEMTFEEEKPQSVAYDTDLTVYSETDKFGLAKSGQRMLPAQFDEVGLMYGNRAFVKQNGKWGLVELLPDLSFNLSINKGKDIAFRHQTFETQLRLDLPPRISAKEARVEIPESTGCAIDKTSRETKDTESGNYVLYNCTLNIPSSLPDTITELRYEPVSVSCDGISFFDVPVKVRAWHLKYYNVDPIDSETTVEDAVASFTVNINAQRNVGEGDYPFEVKVEADSITVGYEKISETRYKCTVFNLKEGENNLNIYVTEQGCPSSIFPFEITYTKPVPKEKKKEGVVIRKKKAVETPKDPSAADVRLEL